MERQNSPKGDQKEDEKSKRIPFEAFNCLEKLVLIYEFLQMLKDLFSL